MLRLGKQIGDCRREVRYKLWTWERRNAYVTN